MIYLYCLLRAAGDPPSDLLGIDGSRVRAIDLEGLYAWVGDMDVSTVVATPERARAHDRVVRTALDRETPLPARFGQLIGDEAILAQTVSRRRPDFESALERVAGMVEMTVRILLRDSKPERGEPHATSGDKRPTTGREYLERAAITQRQEQNVLADEGMVRARVSSAVSPLVRGESFTGATPGSSMATLSHLVPRENVEAYRGALRALRNEAPAVRIMVSGPWAPYSFTEGIGT